MTSVHSARATRFMTTLPALYRRSGDQGWKRGVTKDVSDTGVLFESGEQLPVESIIELTFHLPEQLGNLPAGQLTCLGKVVRHRAASEAVPPRSAARFLELQSGPES